MKVSITAAALTLAIASSASSAASAADGTITINGEITSATCSIDGNGGGAKDFTINLPKVGAGSFNGVAGEAVGQEAFHISLSGSTCTESAAAIRFEGDNSDPVTGDLRNIATTGASNVQVRITDTAGNQINANSNEGSPWVTITAKEARLDYRVKYVSTAATTTPGVFTTQARYTIVYQ